MEDHDGPSRTLSRCHSKSPDPLLDLRLNFAASLKIRNRTCRLPTHDHEQKVPSVSRKEIPIPRASTTRRLASQTYDCAERYSIQSRRLVSADVYLDGAQSSSGSEATDHDASPPPDSQSLYPETPTPTTVPQTAGVRPNTLATFWSDSADAHRQRRRQVVTEESPLSRSGDSRLSRLSNRFVPIRESSSPIADRFRTSKDPHRLSTSERLVRQDAALPDPFLSRSQHYGAAGPAQRSSRSDGSDRRNGKQRSHVSP